jgi:hypothetical protein
MATAPTPTTLLSGARHTPTTPSPTHSPHTPHTPNSRSSTPDRGSRCRPPTRALQHATAAVAADSPPASCVCVFYVHISATELAI